MEGWLTMPEVAGLLGRSLASVGNYRRFCGLPATQRSRVWFARPEDVEEWRSRPEIAAMLAMGERMHGHRKAVGRQLLTVNT